jgi:hypothetical protein
MLGHQGGSREGNAGTVDNAIDDIPDIVQRRSRKAPAEMPR